MSQANTSERHGLPSEKEITTTLYEDNIAGIARLKGRYIKGDRVKHISPKFFFHSCPSKEWGR